jgi:hypothetical protein
MFSLRKNGGHGKMSEKEKADEKEDFEGGDRNDCDACDLAVAQAGLGLKLAVAKYAAAIVVASEATAENREIARFDQKRKATIVDYRDGSKTGEAVLHDGDKFDLIIGVALAEAYANHGGKREFEKHCLSIWRGEMPECEHKAILKAQLAYKAEKKAKAKAKAEAAQKAKADKDAKSGQKDVKDQK